MVWSVFLFCFIHLSEDSTIAMEKEGSDDCFSVPVLTLKRKKQAGATYLYKWSIVGAKCRTSEYTFL